MDKRACHIFYYHLFFMYLKKKLDRQCEFADCYLKRIWPCLHLCELLFCLDQISCTQRARAPKHWCQLSVPKFPGCFLLFSYSLERTRLNLLKSSRRVAIVWMKRHFFTHSSSQLQYWNKLCVAFNIIRLDTWVVIRITY